MTNLNPGLKIIQIKIYSLRENTSAQTVEVDHFNDVGQAIQFLENIKGINVKTADPGQGVRESLKILAELEEQPEMIDDVYQRVERDYCQPELLYKEAISMREGYAPLVNPTPTTGHVYGDWKVGEFITERNLNFYEGCIVKYVDRHRRKEGKKDLLKARDYLDQLLKEYD